MTDPMTTEELRACRERAEAATAGDLAVARDDEDHGSITYEIERGGFTLAFVPEDTRGKWEHSSAKADATFWASARTDVLRLVSELHALRDDCAQLSAEFGLPPGIRPANGEITRLLATIAARDAQLEAVAEVLSAHGCDCDCGCDCDGHGDDCDPCLGCRIEAAIKAGECALPTPTVHVPDGETGPGLRGGQ